METKQLYHIKPADNKSQLSEAALELVEYAAKTYGYCIADEEQLKEIESDIRQRAEKAPRGNMIAAPKVTSWTHPTNKTYFIGIDGWPLVCNRTRFVQINNENI